MQKLFWILVVLDLVLASSGVKERKINRISEVLNVPDSIDTEESPNMSSGSVPIASSSSSTVSLNSLPGTEPMTLSDALVEIDFDDLLAEVDTVVPVETAELTDFIIAEK